MLFRFFSSIFESYTAMKLAWALAFSGRSTLLTKSS
jgi:hypothetical protein